MGWWGAGIFLGRNVWSHQSTTELRQLSHNTSFLQVGLLDVVRTEDPDKSHNFTNLIFLWRPTLVLYIRGYSIPVSELLFTCLSQHSFLVEWLWDNGRRAKTQRVGRLYLCFQENQETKSLFYICTQITSLSDWQAFKKKKERVKTNKPQKERFKRAFEEQGKRVLQKCLQSRLKNLWSMV